LGGGGGGGGEVGVGDLGGGGPSTLEVILWGVAAVILAGFALRTSNVTSNDTTMDATEGTTTGIGETKRAGGSRRALVGEAEREGGEGFEYEEYEEYGEGGGEMEVLGGDKKFPPEPLLNSETVETGKTGSQGDVYAHSVSEQHDGHLSGKVGNIGCRTGRGPPVELSPLLQPSHPVPRGQRGDLSLGGGGGGAGEGGEGAPEFELNEERVGCPGGNDGVEEKEWKEGKEGGGEVKAPGKGKEGGGGGREDIWAGRITQYEDIQGVKVPRRFAASEPTPAKCLLRWEATLRWREEEQVDGILDRPHPHFSAIKRIYSHYFHGRDKRGNVIYIDQPGTVKIKSLHAERIGIPQLCRHYIYVTEFLWQRLALKDERALTTSILDLTGEWRRGGREGRGVHNVAVVLTAS
jgi:hypothetical protein